LLKEVKLLGKEGFSEEELKRSKAKIVGQKKIARQDLGGYAITVALDELYGLGHDNIDLEDARYEAVTLADIKAAARKYLTPNALVLATIKPPPDSKRAA
jgi:zinc protease